MSVHISLINAVIAFSLRRMREKKKRQRRVGEKVDLEPINSATLSLKICTTTKNSPTITTTTSVKNVCVY